MSELCVCGPLRGVDGEDKRSSRSLEVGVSPSRGSRDERMTQIL